MPADLYGRCCLCTSAFALISVQQEKACCITQCSHNSPNNRKAFHCAGQPAFGRALSQDSNVKVDAGSFHQRGVLSSLWEHATSRSGPLSSFELELVGSRRSTQQALEQPQQCMALVGWQVGAGAMGLARTTQAHAAAQAHSATPCHAMRACGLCLWPCSNA